MSSLTYKVSASADCNDDKSSPQSSWWSSTNFFIFLGFRFSCPRAAAAFSASFCRSFESVGYAVCTADAGSAFGGISGAGGVNTAGAAAGDGSCDALNKQSSGLVCESGLTQALSSREGSLIAPVSPLIVPIWSRRATLLPRSLATLSSAGLNSVGERGQTVCNIPSD